MTNPGDMESFMGNRACVVFTDGCERICTDAQAGMRRFRKKVRSDAELRWRRQCHDARWEQRVEHLMVQFSPPSALLPRPSGLGRPR